MKKLIKFIIIAITISLNQVAFAAFTIIIDAGSSGSRLHLFQHDTSSRMPVINEIFSASTKPGLSHYADHPGSAGKALKPLLDEANQYLKEHHIDPHTVSFNLLATAGMRLIPAHKQQAIYQHIQQYLYANYKFNIANIKTVSGKMEALYGWLDINYLEHHFQQHTKTLGAIDMGGASTEIAFATNNQNKLHDVITVTINGETYHVFCKSFLPLGQDEVRKVINKNRLANTCYPRNYQFSDANKGNFEYHTCQSLFATFLSKESPMQKMLAPEYQQSFVAYSAIYYAYDFLGVVATPTRNMIENSLQTTCTKSWEQLKKDYPTTPEPYLSSYCANGIYITNLLFDTYHLQSTQLKITNRIEGHEIDWTLGALLYQLTNSMPALRF